MIDWCWLQLFNAIDKSDVEAVRKLLRSFTPEDVNFSIPRRVSWIRARMPFIHSLNVFLTSKCAGIEAAGSVMLALLEAKADPDSWSSDHDQPNSMADLKQVLSNEFQRSIPSSHNQRDLPGGLAFAKMHYLNQRGLYDSLFFDLLHYLLRDQRNRAGVCAQYAYQLLESKADLAAPCPSPRGPGTAASALVRFLQCCAQYCRCSCAWQLRCLMQSLRRLRWSGRRASM